MIPDKALEQEVQAYFDSELTSVSSDLLNLHTLVAGTDIYSSPDESVFLEQTQPFYDSLKKRVTELEVPENSEASAQRLAVIQEFVLTLGHDIKSKAYHMKVRPEIREIENLVARGKKVWKVHQYVPDGESPWEHRMRRASALLQSIDDSPHPLSVKERNYLFSVAQDFLGSTRKLEDKAIEITGFADSINTALGIADNTEFRDRSYTPPCGERIPIATTGNKGSLRKGISSIAQKIKHNRAYQGAMAGAALLTILSSVCISTGGSGNDKVADKPVLNKITNLMQGTAHASQNTISKEAYNPSVPNIISLGPIDSNRFKEKNGIDQSDSPGILLDTNTCDVYIEDNRSRILVNRGFWDWKEDDKKSKKEKKTGEPPTICNLVKGSRLMQTESSSRILRVRNDANEGMPGTIADLVMAACVHSKVTGSDGEKMDGLKLIIGDISRKRGGGKLGGHKSHMCGLDQDTRPPAFVRSYDIASASDARKCKAKGLKIEFAAKGKDSIKRICGKYVTTDWGINAVSALWGKNKNKVNGKDVMITTPLKATYNVMLAFNMQKSRTSRYFVPVANSTTEEKYKFDLIESDKRDKRATRYFKYSFVDDGRPGHHAYWQFYGDKVTDRVLMWAGAMGLDKENGYEDILYASYPISPATNNGKCTKSRRKTKKGKKSKKGSKFKWRCTMGHKDHFHIRIKPGPREGKLHKYRSDSTIQKGVAELLRRNFREQYDKHPRPYSVISSISAYR